MRIDTTPPTDFLGKKQVRRDPEYIAQVSWCSALRFHLTLLPIIVLVALYFVFGNNMQLNTTIADTVNNLVSSIVGSQTVILTPDTTQMIMSLGLPLVYLLICSIVQLVKCIGASLCIFEFYDDLVLFRSGKRKGTILKFSDWFKFMFFGVDREEKFEMRTLYGVYDARIVRIPVSMRIVIIPYLYIHLKEILCGYGNVLVYCPGGLESTMLFSAVKEPKKLVEYLNGKKVKERTSYNYDFVRAE